MIRRCAYIAIVLLIALQTACIPRVRGDSVAVDDRHEADAQPPSLPEGNVSVDTMVDAVRFDLTNRPDDQDYWSLSEEESGCAAEKIVTAIGSERLSELGFQPGTPGAGIPQLAFSGDERKEIVSGLVDCVDHEEMAAALLFGAGRISADSATCMGSILAEAGVPASWLESWVFGAEVDPFADDAVSSKTMSSAAQICLDPNALNWPTLRSPVEDELVIDADAPPGAANSDHPDDHRTDNAASDGDRTEDGGNG